MFETPDLLHLTPEDHRVVGAEDLGWPGVSVQESIGPKVPILALGPLRTAQDTTFQPGAATAPHPHRRRERLFYVLSGSLGHEDARNGITGHLGTGDLGILTEGRGMLHAEWNPGDAPARCYTLAYTCDPVPEAAAFDVIPASQVRRSLDSHGGEVRHLLEAGDARLHGDIRELADSTLAHGAVLIVELGPDECGLVYVLDGEVEFSDERPAGAGHTIVVPPAPEFRQLEVGAIRDSRVLHVVAGPGVGLRLA